MSLPDIALSKWTNEEWIDNRHRDTQKLVNLIKKLGMDLRSKQNKHIIDLICSCFDRLNCLHRPSEKKKVCQTYFFDLQCVIFWHLYQNMTASSQLEEIPDG